MAVRFAVSSLFSKSLIPSFAFMGPSFLPAQDGWTRRPRSSVCVAAALCSHRTIRIASTFTYNRDSEFQTQRKSAATEQAARGGWERERAGSGLSGFLVAAV